MVRDISIHLLRLFPEIKNEGRIRLNLYLHILQNFWVAKTGELLFEEPIYAATYGGEVYRSSGWLVTLAETASRSSYVVNIPNDKKEFIEDLGTTLGSLSLEDLKELAQQDPQWQAKCAVHGKIDPLSDKKDTLS